MCQGHCLIKLSDLTNIANHGGQSEARLVLPSAADGRQTCAQCWLPAIWHGRLTYQHVRCALAFVALAMTDFINPGAHCNMKKKSGSRRRGGRTCLHLEAADAGMGTTLM